MIQAIFGFAFPLLFAWGQTVTITGTKSFEFPDSPGGRCAKAFIEAFNSGSVEIMRAFEEAHRAQSALKTRSIEDRLKQYGDMKANWGRLEPRQVVGSNPQDVTLLVYAARPDIHFEFRFVLEEQTPYGLKHIEVQGPIQVVDGGKPLVPMTQQQRSATLEAIAVALEDNYVFPDIGAKMAAMLREKAAQDAYIGKAAPGDFARTVTEDLRDICKDKHLGVRLGERPDFHGGGPMRRRGSAEDARRENYGFRQVELLPGNIGYIRFDEFNPSEDAMQTAAAAMAFVAGCDALIFDLRYNGGGSPEMIRFLSSYLFDKPTHLNSFYDRSNDKTSEVWTLETVQGKRFGEELPVFVLTSNQTFSGAEEFAYNLRNLKRATIVGETTGGGAHPVRPIRVNEGFHVMVPFARAINPISQTNWEGVGVQPHVETRAADALDKARELATAVIENRHSGSGTK